MLWSPNRRGVHALLALLLLPTAALAETGGGHADPVTAVLGQLIIMLVAAKIGGSLFLRLNQPAVLGELIAGVVLGNVLLLWGPDTVAAAFVSEVLEPGHPVDILARLGVILLLFGVGLETSLVDMLRVGLPSLLVAVVGVVAPFLLGMGVSRWLLPGEHHPLVAVFIATTLCATSVGITARVLKELGQLDRDESRIVLGAAVIDDVLGLVVLAVVTAMVAATNSGQALAVGHIVRLTMVALGFLVGSVVLGRWLAPCVFGLASQLRGNGVLLVTALAACFGLSALAGVVGLAPIVGAFAAGLLLDEVHYRDLRDNGETHDLTTLIEPINEMLVPLFFVQMGMTVKLSSFAVPGVMWFAVSLTVAAILGKQVCGLVVRSPLDRLSIGIAMVPRGEVGLIVAAMGRQLQIGGEQLINDVANSAVVIMVIVTTMVAPPALTWSLRRSARRQAAHAAETATPQ